MGIGNGQGQGPRAWQQEVMFNTEGTIPIPHQNEKIEKNILKLEVEIGGVMHGTCRKQLYISRYIWPPQFLPPSSKISIENN